jgi:glycosyltransferase involved in cell wall biosynthesis
MQKKYFLVIIPWLEDGGSEHLLYDVMTEFIKKYRIIIVLTEKSNNPLFSKFEKLTNCILDFSSLKNPKEFGKNISALIKLLSIEIILTSNSQISYEASEYFKGTVPIRRYDILHNNSQEGHIKKAISTSKHITKHIVVDSHIKSSLLSSKVDKKKIVDINNAVSPNLFFKLDRLAIGEKKKELKIKENYFVLGFIGRASHEKRPLLFLQEFYKLSKIKRVHAIILSSGPLEKLMLKYIKNKKIEKNITWLKPTCRENLVYIYNVLDILVNSSYIEGQPLTLIEAHMCGIPFLSFNVGGISKMTDGKDSLLLSKDESLFKKLSEICDDPKIVCKMKKELLLNFRTKKLAYATMISKYKKALI